MNDKKPDEEFWNIADRFIELANSQSENSDAGIVGEALIYAASRFSAFIVASGSESKKDFQEDKQESLRYLSAQFKKMLADNLDDYEEHFKEYTQQRIEN